jgi:hypothetical protein
LRLGAPVVPEDYRRDRRVRGVEQYGAMHLSRQSHGARRGARLGRQAAHGSADGEPPALAVLFAGAGKRMADRQWRGGGGDHHGSLIDHTSLDRRGAEIDAKIHLTSPSFPADDRPERDDP